MSLNDAGAKVHPVESQWHYEILTKYGYVAKTKEAVGLVRSYDYSHPAGGHIRVTTGISSDYWYDKVNDKQGYWSDLEPHLRKLKEK